VIHFIALKLAPTCVKFRPHLSAAFVSVLRIHLLQALCTQQTGLGWAGDGGVGAQQSQQYRGIIWMYANGLWWMLQGRGYNFLRMNVRSSKSSTNQTIILAAVRFLRMSGYRAAARISCTVQSAIPSILWNRWPGFRK